MRGPMRSRADARVPGICGKKGAEAIREMNTILRQGLREGRVQTDRQTDTQKVESPRAHSPKEVRTGVNRRGVKRGVNRQGVNRQGVNIQGVNRQGVNSRVRSTQCSLYAPEEEIGGDFGRSACFMNKSYYIL